MQQHTTNTEAARRILAVDFETYYDKTVSIKKLGPLGYFSDPKFDAYLVSVVDDSGDIYVGHPKDYDWSQLEGNIVLSHNASFDETLYLYGCDKGWWARHQPAEWYCTADMCAYHGVGRSLKNAVKSALGIELSKTVRDNMSGRRWDDLEPEFQKQVIDYAHMDSEYCLKLWQKLGSEWPERERLISHLNRRGVQQGIPINPRAINEGREKLTKLLFDLENSVPWYGDAPLLSREAFNKECHRLGIEPPASLAQTDPKAKKFFDKHQEKLPWVTAVRDYRRVNTQLKKVESFDLGAQPNNRYYGNIMYGGAHTLRFSGSGGNLNLQNLPRGEMFGVDMRKFISAHEGRRLVVVDLSQIEVRTVCWLAGWGAMLEKIAQSEDIYQAFAEQFGLWKPERGDLRSDSKLRGAVKEMVLTCQYQGGHERLHASSGLPLQESHRLVNLYRSTMKPIKALWDSYKRDIEASYRAQQPFTIELPLRKLNYGHLQKRFRKNPSGGTNRLEYVALLEKSGKRVPARVYGGLCTENAAQALARDVFCDMMVRIHDALGILPVMHVHDEFVYDVAEADAEDTLTKVIDIMSTSPDWIKDLPVAAEGKVLTHYEK